MLNRNALRKFALAAGVAALTLSGWANADPPSVVARLGYITGAVSLSPAGESDWVLASVNRPMTTGDRVWVDGGGRAEIQVGGALLRLNADTGVSILNLDDRITQLQLTQGAMNVRVRRLDANQVVEVDTPNLALTIRRPGEFRIEVDADGSATTIVVRNGQGEVYGQSASYVVDSRQTYRFAGTDLRDYEPVATPRFDEFDRWSVDRDRIYDNSLSARYVSQDVMGYQDLDSNGSWRVDANYGAVWYPTRVNADWAPYRDGHWAWVDPWGWTWVDDAPWGFAVSHYGRWAYLGGNWGWVPGPVRSHAYYAPALVVFVGGDNFQLAISGGNVGGIGWFPLGPREVYRPWYPASRDYFDNVNRTNTVVNTTIINNTYNNTNVTNIVYANRQVPGAVIAVPTTAFVQSQPVSRMAIRVSRDVVATAPVVAVAPVAPTVQSVRGAAGPGGKPPGRAFERPVVARAAPPAAPVGFAAQQQQLTANRGKPLDDAARKEIRPAAATQAPVVSVAAQPATPSPTQRPPSIARDGKPGGGRPGPDARNAGAPSATAPAPVAPERVTPSVAAPKPANGPARMDPRNADQRNADQRNADQRNAGQRNADQRNADQRSADQRNDVNARKPAAPPMRAASPDAQPQATPRAQAPAQSVEPTAPTAESRGNKPEQRSGGMQRGAEPKPAPPQAQSTSRPTQAPDQRPAQAGAAPQANAGRPAPSGPPPVVSQAQPDQASPNAGPYARGSRSGAGQRKPVKDERDVTKDDEENPKR